MEISIWNDYIFEVGDEVIDTGGKKGKIIDICDCPECTNRGFHELIWRRYSVGNAYSDYITISDAESGFLGYFKIGKYRFNDFNRDGINYLIRHHEKEIENLKERLKFMDEEERKHEIN